MSQELLAVLKDLVLPPGGALILLLAGLLLWRRAVGRLLVLLATVALYLAAIPQTSAWLAAPLETDPSVDAAGIQAAGAQAVVVFLAGRSHRAPELGGRDGLSPLSLQRLHHGVRLARASDLPLVVSGGAAPDEPGAEGLAALARRALLAVYGMAPLIAEDGSANTRENATHTAALLDQLGIHKVALVTHAWHMPRARYSAEQAGLTVVTAGTGFVATSGDRPSELGDWLPRASALALNRNLLHEHLGLWWYRHGGRSD